MEGEEEEGRGVPLADLRVALRTLQEDLPEGLALEALESRLDAVVGRMKASGELKLQREETLFGTLPAAVVVVLPFGSFESALERELEEAVAEKRAAEGAAEAAVSEDSLEDSLEDVALEDVALEDGISSTRSSADGFVVGGPSAGYVEGHGCDSGHTHSLSAAAPRPSVVSHRRPSLTDHTVSGNPWVGIVYQLVHVQERVGQRVAAGGRCAGVGISVLLSRASPC